MANRRQSPLNFNYVILTSRQDVTNFKGYIYVFKTQLSIGVVRIIYDQTGSGKSKMAAVKPEIHIFHDSQKISTARQMLSGTGK